MGGSDSRRVEIAGMKPERWKEYRELRLQGLRTDPTAFGSSAVEEEALTEAEWRKRTPDSLFAVLDGALIGTIGYRLNPRLKMKHVAEIFGVYVVPEQRGKGVGAMLVGEALNRIRKEKGIKKVKLSVNPEQRGAVRLYERAGFVFTGIARKELKVGQKYYDLLYLEREL